MVKPMASHAKSMKSRFIKRLLNWGSTQDLAPVCKPRPVQEKLRYSRHGTPVVAALDKSFGEMGATCGGEPYLPDANMNIHLRILGVPAALVENFKVGFVRPRATKL
jgi:hypothetical protein